MTTMPNPTPEELVAKWRKKPVVIEAAQFDGTIRTASAICQWANAGDADAGHDDATASYIVHNGDDVTAHDMVIWTLEGDMTASPGDWIIRGVQGEFYPCKPDIFAATYEPAESALASREPAGEFKGWYCAHCQRGVDASEVTYHEQHVECGRVITDDVPPQPKAARGAVEELVSEWRECAEGFGHNKLGQAIYRVCADKLEAALASQPVAVSMPAEPTQVMVDAFRKAHDEHADARRYRWLRGEDVDVSRIFDNDDDEGFTIKRGAELDAAIDAAIAASGERLVPERGEVGQ